MERAEPGDEGMTMSQWGQRLGPWGQWGQEPWVRGGWGEGWGSEGALKSAEKPCPAKP